MQVERCSNLPSHDQCTENKENELHEGNFETGERFSMN